eukprot:gene1189-biopygen9524
MRARDVPVRSRTPSSDVPTGIICQTCYSGGGVYCYIGIDVCRVLPTSSAASPAAHLRNPFTPYTKVHLYPLQSDGSYPRVELCHLQQSARRNIRQLTIAEINMCHSRMAAKSLPQSKTVVRLQCSPPQPQLLRLRSCRKV